IRSAMNSIHGRHLRPASIHVLQMTLQPHRGLLEISMLNRLSVNVLLKSVIVILSLAVVVMLGLTSLESWHRLQSIHRIASVTEISSQLFTALHNLRVDRSSTNRELNYDHAQQTHSKQNQEVRAAQMPALKAAIAGLEKVDYPEKATTYPQLVQL